MGRIHDVSPPIHPGIAVWPGDVPYRQDFALRIDQGANLDLSSIQTTLHLGAHADGPRHYALGAPGIGQRPLGPYLGACELRRVRVAPGARILPADVGPPPRAPRLLLQTGSFPDPDRFAQDFASLSPELVDWLADQGVVLVGIDTPSVDPFASKALESHQALLRRDLSVLEGLVLEHVPPGLYTLIALPLRIVEGDASPVRAVLVEGALDG